MYLSGGRDGMLFLLWKNRKEQTHDEEVRHWQINLGFLISKRRTRLLLPNCHWKLELELELGGTT